MRYDQRQHYALNNQNRIIRLEALEETLSEGQLLALRLASDKELSGLVQRTLKENLKPDEIKKSIVDWVPDPMRV